MTLSRNALCLPAIVPGVLVLFAAGAWADPPPPVFSLPGGTGACPFSISLSDADSTASIFYTTDGSMYQVFGNAITVSGNMTITAYAQDNASNTASAAVSEDFSCGTYTSVEITITTGRDDARTDSAIQAMLEDINGKVFDRWCLKYSDNGAFDSCPQNHPGIPWDPHTTNPTPVVPRVLPVGVAPGGFDSMTLIIQLVQFPGLGKGDDNWDVYALTLNAIISNASPEMPMRHTVMSKGGPQQNGDQPCYARFKHVGGSGSFPSAVRFHVDTNIPDTVSDDDGSHNAPYCAEDTGP